jgi:hypothetical protein
MANCVSGVSAFEIAFEGGGEGGMLTGGIGVGVAVLSTWLNSSVCFWLGGKGIAVEDGVGVKAGSKVAVGEASGSMASAAEVGWGDSQKS